MKIVIVDDDPDIVDSISLIIHMMWPECEIISSGLGCEGLDLVSREMPDAVILDLELPDISGFDVLKEIRLFSHVPVMILSVKATEEDIVKGLEMGANEYLVKPFRQLEFLARLKLLIKKQDPSYIMQRFNIGKWQFDPSGHKLLVSDKVVNLTNTESAILSHLVTNRGKVVTFSSLAELLWQEEYPGYKDAIQVYIRRLRKKIEIDPSNPALIHTQTGIGYYLE
jgi:two-component system KDP operon response regulator KdpE